MQPYTFRFLQAAIMFAILQVGTTRDLRNVTEPKTPQICTTLTASGEVATETIQNALDSCTKGKAVALTSGTFNSGPLRIPSGVSLLVDSGATLAAVPTPALYDVGTNKCGKIDDSGTGCKPFISIVRATGSGIYGKGKIDGCGGTRMTGTNITWWHLARNALAVHKQQNNPVLIQINNSVDITIHQITLVNSPFYHVHSRYTFGFTVWGITINTPGAALNSDGIDPIGSINVTITHCNISTGDDNIAIAGILAPSRHISVINNYFGHGNAMAIRKSLDYGVSDVTITNLTLNNVRLGLLIKSDTVLGGHLTNITYDNICIYKSVHPINVQTSSLYIAPHYTSVVRNISFNNVKVHTNASFIIHGISNTDPIQITMKNVHISKGSTWSVRNAIINGTWEEDADDSACGDYGN